MLKCSRALFNLDKQVSYLNNAYMSPNLKSVEIAGVVGVRRKSQPYLLEPEDFFQPVLQLKKSFAQLIHCTDHTQISIVPSVSYGLANVAANIPIQKKRNIVLPFEQFPSNYYVWEQLAKANGLELRLVKPPSALTNRTKGWNEAILDAIDGDTLLVACGHVHWADGTLFDIEAFRTACSSVDAFLIIDGSQSVGALPFDVMKVKPDALVCAGYKWLFGPYGIGLAYYGNRFNEGKPIEENWANRKGSENFKNLVQYQTAYKEGAARYSVGESSNFITIPMMQTALDQILAWGVENLDAYVTNLLKDYLPAFQNLGFSIEQERSNHLIGIKLPKHLSIDLIVRQLREKNVYVSVRGNSIRLSTSIYNSKRDLDQFLSVLHHAEMV